MDGMYPLLFFILFEINLDTLLYRIVNNLQTSTIHLAFAFCLSLW